MWRRVTPQKLLPPPLLLEEVLPLSLGLRSLAEVSSHGLTEAGGKRVDGEVLQLTGHGTVKEARHLGTLSQDAAGGLCGGKKLDHPLPGPVCYKSTVSNLTPAN